jgi:hypothetical protein
LGLRRQWPSALDITVPGSAANPSPRPPNAELVRSRPHTSPSSQKSSYDGECAAPLLPRTHREQHRRTRMPKVVQSDASHTSSSAQRLERSVDVPGLAREDLAHPILGPHDKRRTVYRVEARRPHRRRITDTVQPRCSHDSLGLSRGQGSCHRLRRGRHTPHMRPPGRQLAQSLFRVHPRAALCRPP